MKEVDAVLGRRKYDINDEDLPVIVVHGTYLQFWESINRHGLRKYALRERWLNKVGKKGKSKGKGKKNQQCCKTSRPFCFERAR